MDLDGYFRRVGYAGPRAPSLEVLRALHRLHPAAIPFETIDVVRGLGADLSPVAVDAKLIAGGRGGYCFEQNTLFKRVLTALGFEAEGLIGRSRWGRSPDDIPPRTHMAVRVRINGDDWLADVGFGGCMLTAPLNMTEAEPQATDFEPMRLRACGEELRQEAYVREAWQPVCDFVTEPQRDADFIAPNWWASTHPDSVFRRMLIVTRTLPAVRFTLRENWLTIRRHDAEPERRALSVTELEQSLATNFALPVSPDWRPMLQDAVKRGESWQTGAGLRT